jgi:acyl carrier protein
LKIENIGINDSFFDLGGESLLAIRAISRIRDVFDVDLTVQNIFLMPTIAELANVLTKAKHSSEKKEVGGSGKQKKEIDLEDAIRMIG